MELGEKGDGRLRGVLEIADVFVVNKADRDGAERLEAELQSMLGLGEAPQDLPIVRTVASRDEGVAALWSAVEGVRAQRASTGQMESRRREQLRHRLEQAVVDRLRQRMERTVAPAQMEALLARVAARELDPGSAARALVEPEALSSGLARIDHLGIAVRNLDAAVAAYRALGFTVERILDVPTEKVRVAFLPIGESHLELLEPTDPGSTIAKFLEKRAGLHHVCVLVDDIEAELARLKAAGVALVDETPRVGAGGCRVAFLHPKAAEGVLVELKQA